MVGGSSLAFRNHIMLQLPRMFINPPLYSGRCEHWGALTKYQLPILYNILCDGTGFASLVAFTPRILPFSACSKGIGKGENNIENSYFYFTYLLHYPFNTSLKALLRRLRGRHHGFFSGRGRRERDRPNMGHLKLLFPTLLAK